MRPLASAARGQVRNACYAFARNHGIQIHVAMVARQPTGHCDTDFLAVFVEPPQIDHGAFRVAKAKQV